MTSKIYDIVTQKVIERLEEVSAAGYKQPWFCVGHSPFNAISKKAYRGINYITLAHGYNSKAWASYKQWADKGCHVRKGEKSSLAVFWMINEFEDDGGDKRTVPLLRFYNVFNSEQVEGEFAREVEKGFFDKLKNHDPIKEAQELVDYYLKNERLSDRNGDRAYYSHNALIGSEYISMPLPGQFNDIKAYYSVFLHEIIHSTGSDKRLNRDLSGKFGSKNYAIEELVAELGAAMLCGAIGMDQSPRDDHAMYIKTWLQALKNDNRFIITAASAAQKAADFVQKSAANYRDFLNKSNLIAAE